MNRDAVHRKRQCTRLTMNAPEEKDAAHHSQAAYRENAQAISGFVKRNAVHRKRQCLHLTLTASWKKSAARLSLLLPGKKLQAQLKQQALPRQEQLRQQLHQTQVKESARTKS